jgi:DNA-directed RNA polymerase specialized sigma24 family protein
MAKHNGTSCPSVERVPVRFRKPVSKEYIADYLSNRETGHPAESHFLEALFTSVAGIVHKLAFKYSATCVGSEDDLAQDCFLRIVENLDKFNSKDGTRKLSTWVWTVCENHLGRTYRYDKRRREGFTTCGGDSLKGLVEPSVSLLTLDVRDAVKALFDMYPERKTLLRMILGGTPEEGIIFSRGRMDIADMAREAGVKYSDAYTFYRDVVRPFFKNRFEEHIDE